MSGLEEAGLPRLQNLIVSPFLEENLDEPA